MQHNMASLHGIMWALFMHLSSALKPGIQVSHTYIHVVHRVDKTAAQRSV